MATEEERFLTEYVPREYPSVALAVDLVVFAVTAGTLNAVFVRRGAHPFKGSPALPGGFALPAEDALAAAWRDAGENRVLVGKPESARRGPRPRPV